MRRIPFCAGHRLVGHEGKCVHLHGHNYVVEIYVTGSKVDSLGRIVDFAVINRLFKDWIDNHWDHGFVLWDQDLEAIRAIESVQPARVYKIPYNPTAENMAAYLLHQIGPKLLAELPDYDLRLTKVILCETEKSAAIVELP
ncbi:MAG: 6-carboxytetrahydropterin synthase [Pirellulaceae bacterium]|nr:6-carboxytetrahydropterin synthase [Pirellulaceae bacterium]